MRDFIVHDQRDNVGVAVVDIQPGHTAKGAALDGGAVADIPAREAIPLGHKIALRDFKAGETIIKYGEDIGKVVAPIRAGEHVHVHNLKTKRW
ncbi:MAG TPA: UxaA family hydrolase [Terriglobia bacterium]|nr:UxaA family hydrolase [Terriglobia bacterium]